MSIIYTLRALILGDQYNIPWYNIKRPVPISKGWLEVFSLSTWSEEVDGVPGYRSWNSNNKTGMEVIHFQFKPQIIWKGIENILFKRMV